MKRRQESTRLGQPAKSRRSTCSGVVIAGMLTLSFCLGMGVDRFTADNADAESSLRRTPGIRRSRANVEPDPERLRGPRSGHQRT